jgi:hypothetical protein
VRWVPGQRDWERLDAEKIETLRRWGNGLATGGRDDELRAAGRAILMLAEEIDRLSRDLWHARAGVSDEIAGSEPGEPPPDDPERRRFPLVDALTRRLGGKQHLPASH